MSKRSEHTFQFPASEIEAAASNEAAYHEARLAHWQERADTALSTVKKTIGAKVVERQVTGGAQADVVVDYGDPAAWREYQTSMAAIQRHRDDAERYRSDQRVYGTQGDRVYELDTDDVHHYRLNGAKRED